MTPREAAIKRITDAGSRWPPAPTKPVEPWHGSGRYTTLSCRGCGAACDPARRRRLMSRSAISRYQGQGQGPSALLSGCLLLALYLRHETRTGRRLRGSILRIPIVRQCPREPR